MTKNNTSEATLLKLVWLAESKKPGVTLFRNGTGMLRNADGTAVKYGLHKGSSDLIDALFDFNVGLPMLISLAASFSATSALLRPYMA